MLRIMTRDDAVALLRNVAQQSYGSGCFQKTEGGHGYVGVIGGKPVKFGTHWKERGLETDEMRRSSNELRMALGRAASVLVNGDGTKSAALQRIYASLGLEADGSKVLEGQPLLKRTVTAAVVKEIDRLRAEEGASFDGVRATSSSGVNTRYEMRCLVNAAEALGIRPTAKQAEVMLASIIGGKAVYLHPDHRQHCVKLLGLLNGDTHLQLNEFDGPIKLAADILRNLPGEKRLQGLAIALAAGPEPFVGSGLCCPSTMSELIALKGKSPVVDRSTVVRWADGIIAKFRNTYPSAPPLDANLTQVTQNFKISTAKDLSRLMKYDEFGYGKTVLSAGTTEGCEIDLESWKQPPAGDAGARVPLLSRLTDNSFFDDVGRIADTCFLDVETILSEYDGNGFGLSLSSLPPGTQPVVPNMIGDTKTRLEGDLPRTHIVARFLPADRAGAFEVDTTRRPAEKVAEAKTGELMKGVNRLLGLADDAEETPQTRVALAFFRADGMALTRNFITNGEHVPRNMTLVREGDDLLISMRNMDPKGAHFDITVRIRPDGSNVYEHVDVRDNPLGEQTDSVGKLARSLVMGWRNTKDSTARKQIEEMFGTTCLEQLENAKELLNGSPTLVNAFRQVQVPNAEQLKRFDDYNEKSTVELFLKNVKSEDHGGIATEFVRCLNPETQPYTTVQGKSVPLGVKDAASLTGLQKELAEQKWEFLPPSTETLGLLEKIATILSANGKVPVDGEKRKAFTFLATLCMGHNGPSTLLTDEVITELTGVPWQAKMMNANERMFFSSCFATTFQRQDLSVVGNDLVLTQRHVYTPNGFVMRDGEGKIVQLSDDRLATTVLPSLTFVTQMRIPIDQELSSGDVPKFTFSTKVAMGDVPLENDGSQPDENDEQIVT